MASKSVSIIGDIPKRVKFYILVGHNISTRTYCGISVIPHATGDAPETFSLERSYLRYRTQVVFIAECAPKSVYTTILCHLTDLDITPFDGIHVPDNPTDTTYVNLPGEKMDLVLAEIRRTLAGAAKLVDGVPTYTEITLSTPAIGTTSLDIGGTTFLDTDSPHISSYDYR